MGGSSDVLNMSAEDSPQQAHQTNIAIKEDSLSQDEIDRMTQEQKCLYKVRKTKIEAENGLRITGPSCAHSERKLLKDNSRRGVPQTEVATTSRHSILT